MRDIDKIDEALDKIQAHYDSNCEFEIADQTFDALMACARALARISLTHADSCKCYVEDALAKLEACVGFENPKHKQLSAKEKAFPDAQIDFIQG